MKVVIAGGSGFIGRYLVDCYHEAGNDVYIISRTEQSNEKARVLTWHDEDALMNALSGADLLINMAGESVDCRYHKRNKNAILRSRVDTTKQLNTLIGKLKNPPKLWINSSTATIYRDALDRPMTEKDGDIGSGFSVDVATKWERTFFKPIQASTRKVAIRTAIVLGLGGGAFVHFRMLAKIGFGGRQGSGKQMVSFVHILDVYRVIEFIRMSDCDNTVYNVSAPNPVNNYNFMKTFREQLKVKVGLPIFTWMLTIGAFILRTETELLLKSRWVLPDKLTKEGYTFSYPTIREAVSGLISEES